MGLGRIAYTNVRYLHPAKGPDRYCGYSLHAPSIRGGGEKDEAKKYGEFLSDRNLLVHHGGVYTFKYAGQKFPKKDLKRTVHWQSLTVRQANISTWVKLLDDICEKGVSRHPESASGVRKNHCQRDAFHSPRSHSVRIPKSSLSGRLRTLCRRC